MTESDQQLRDRFDRLLSHYGQSGDPNEEVVDAVRAKRRRAKLSTVAAVILVVGVTAAATTPVWRGGHAATLSRPRPLVIAPTVVPITPSEFGALAAGPKGSVFVADPVGNVIFEWLPKENRYRVVAGTGTPGFRGDGGPAVHARISHPGGMVYDSKTQVLYFADEQNNRIREVKPNGDINTVVGGMASHSCFVASGTQALAACLLDPSDVTLSPTGGLVVADTGGNEILAESANGTLTKLAGDQHAAGLVGIGGPAVNASPDGPNGLAYDSAGDLWLSGSDTKTLLVITPNGMLSEPTHQAIYPRGDGGLIASPTGGVYVMDTSAIYLYSGLHERMTVVNFTHREVDKIRGIAPTGIARTANGLLYVGTSNRDGFTNVAALFAVDPKTGMPRLVSRPLAGGYARSTPIAPDSTTCMLRNIGVRLTPYGAGAGHSYSKLILHNSGNRACSFSGGPALEFTNSTQDRVGDVVQAPTIRRYRSRFVALKPGGSAFMVLEFPNPGMYEPGVCHPASTAHMLVRFRPWATSLTVPFSGTICTATNQAVGIQDALRDSS